jgi:hypothetical protein
LAGQSGVDPFDSVGNEVRRLLPKNSATIAIPQNEGYHFGLSQTFQLDREMVEAVRLEMCRTVVTAAKINTTQKTPVIAEKIYRVSMTHTQLN